MKHKIPVDITWYIQGAFVALVMFPAVESLLLLLIVHLNIYWLNIAYVALCIITLPIVLTVACRHKIEFAGDVIKVRLGFIRMVNIDCHHISGLRYADKSENFKINPKSPFSFYYNGCCFYKMQNRVCFNDANGKLYILNSVNTAELFEFLEQRSR